MGFGVKTSVAKDPEQIYSESPRAAGTLYSSTLNWREGKRVLFKVESTLDQAVLIQAIGNIEDATSSATNLNGIFHCEANDNLSVGLAWDDWHPFVGIKITVAVAPTTGSLTINGVVQQ